jgi:hypothetical protein
VCFLCGEGKEVSCTSAKASEPMLARGVPESPPHTWPGQPGSQDICIFSTAQMPRASSALSKCAGVNECAATVYSSLPGRNSTKADNTIYSAMLLLVIV